MGQEGSPALQAVSASGQAIVPRSLLGGSVSTTCYNIPCRVTYPRRKARPGQGPRGRIGPELSLCPCNSLLVIPGINKPTATLWAASRRRHDRRNQGSPGVCFPRPRTSKPKLECLGPKPARATAGPPLPRENSAELGCIAWAAAASRPAVSCGGKKARRHPAGRATAAPAGEKKGAAAEVGDLCSTACRGDEVRHQDYGQWLRRWT